jgi:bifunctional non-homologous end joining protein LigD
VYLGAAIAKLRADVLVLDGEVVVFDAKLVSRFHLLSDANPTEVCTPPIFMAFDVLQIGRRDVRGLPLEHRRIIDEWQLRHLGADRHT